MKLKSVDEILEFAIQKEEGAAQFYTDLAEHMENRHVSRMFRDFAEEELGHKEKLLGIRSGGQLSAAAEKIQNLGIADYAVEVEPSPGMDYQQALMLAMNEEKAAFRMYTALADATDDADLRATLLGLAQDEAKHKLRFEIEYDEYILTEG